MHTNCISIICKDQHILIQLYAIYPLCWYWIYLSLVIGWRHAKFEHIVKPLADQSHKFIVLLCWQKHWPVNYWCILDTTRVYVLAGDHHTPSGVMHNYTEIFYCKIGHDIWISAAACIFTVYPKKYAHGFVVLCFVVVIQSFIMNSH